MKHAYYDSIQTLETVGISYEDAVALRRISMTLHRWHELECGTSDDYKSWCIVRGKRVKVTQPAASTPYWEFEYDDNGLSYLEIHFHRGDGKTKYERYPDRERGALKRLAAIMAKYPTLSHYVQGDPRGAALYILRPGDVPEGMKAESCYNRGIVVCQ